MTFASTPLLVLAIATPALVMLVHLLDRRRQRALIARLGDAPAVQRMMAARSPGRRALKAALSGLGLGLVIAAAARPQVVGKQVTRRKGMDLVIAVDVSKSMLVGDVEVGQPARGWPADLDPDEPRPVPDRPTWVQGTRLERARQMLGELLPLLPDDRIGIVLFAGASIHFPLTDDEHLALRLAHLVGPTDLIGGSDVAEALRVGRCLLRPELTGGSAGCFGIGVRGRGGEPLGGARVPRVAEEKPTEERGRAILVVTDGGQQSASVIEEADHARRLGVALFFVGVGSDQGGVVPELDWQGNVIGAKQDGRGQPVVSKLDREGLRGLGQLAGGPGHYVELAPTGAIDVRPVVEALAKVPRGELERTELDRRRDVYPGFLFAGFMLLVIEAAIGLRRRRVRHPEASP